MGIMLIHTTGRVVSTPTGVTPSSACFSELLACALLHLGKSSNLDTFLGGSVDLGVKWHNSLSSVGNNWESGRPGPLCSTKLNTLQGM